MNATLKCEHLFVEQYSKKVKIIVLYNILCEVGVNEDRGAKAPTTQTCSYNRENYISFIRLIALFYSPLSWLHSVKICSKLDTN